MSPRSTLPGVRATGPRPDAFRPSYDAFDAELINLLQQGIPICESPFRAIAEKLGSSQDEVVARLRRLVEQGTLSRFGPLFNVEHMGGRFTLIAARVPEERFEEVTHSINSRSEVAHNYRRDHPLNMWFVTATETQADTDRVIAEIERETQLELYVFPKLEEYFLDLRLDAHVPEVEEIPS